MTPGKTPLDRAVHAQQTSACIQRQVQALRTLYPTAVPVVLPLSCRVREKGRLKSLSSGILVPSRFEPCGLTQLYGLRYGTLPIVRRVSGLADTVRDTGGARDNGFAFDVATPQALERSVLRAVAMHAQRDTWRERMVTAMGEELSWAQPAAAYLKLYESLRNPASSLPAA